ncbi:MAG: M20 family metallo-hydrolase [Desulfobacca sp.]|uniref:M20 family metallo-hydrolase n=1 Tax=Desulfobacca sp. TaxID=2067990 RepID=UPI00404B98CA
MTHCHNFATLKEIIAGYRQAMIELQRELVCRNAVGPDNHGPGEAEKAVYLAEELRRLGLMVTDYPAPDERVAGGQRPNLIALLPGRRPEKVWVLSHLDVVPVGDENLWRTDPFTLHVDGDLLYGRGVADDHQGIVASLFAVRALRDAGIVPERTIGLALVSDEETGSQKGLAYLLTHQRELFSPQDLIIVPDAGNPDGTLIEIAEKSMLWLRLEVRGRQCHASKPDLGVNTLRACAQAIVALDELASTFNAVEPFYDPPHSTFEPTKIEANVENINTIPGLGVFYLDCRVLPVYDLAQVIAKVEEITGAVAQRCGVAITVQTVQAVQAPPATSAEAPVVKALAAAIQAVYQRQAQPRGIGGGTVAAFFRRLGLPAAVWMTDAQTAHQPNEYVNINTLLGDCQVLAHVFCQEV